MARLRGLASEHHPEGPGDAPRRRKGRKATASIDTTTTNGTKRAASPSVEVTTHTKRTKRVQTDDHDQLITEQEESVSRSQASDTTTVTYPRLRRRYSDPLGAANDEDEDELTGRTPPPATQPLPGLTPHLERVGETRLSRSRRARQSMPAQLHITEVDETDGTREVQFAPLVDVLGPRQKRRLRRSHLSEEINEIQEHKREDVKVRQAVADLQRQLQESKARNEELQFHLEAHRMGDIDMSEDETENLRQRLEEAKQEIDDKEKELDELKASSAYGPDSGETSGFAGNDFDDDDNDNALTLEDLGMSQEDMVASPLPNGIYATRVVQSSQVTVESLDSISQTTHDVLAGVSQSSTSVPDKISDQAVKRFEIEIEDLTRQLADSQGHLRVFTIELQNLHIVAPGASVNSILSSLRHVLEDGREKYERLFSKPVTGLTNADFIKQVVADLQVINAELLVKTTLAEKQHQRIALLESQYEGTTNILSQVDSQNTDLLMKQEQLEASNTEKEEQVRELQDKLKMVHQLAQIQDTQLLEKDATINGLKDEIEDKDTSLERLRDALESYRLEVETLTAAVNRLEQDHETRISQMEVDHAANIQELQTQLDVETGGRALAEGEAQQKTEYIDELENRIAGLSGDIDGITANLTQLRQRLVEETTNREAAEAERDEYDGLAYDRANTIENLKETINDLEAQLATFRTNLDAERNQRQQTEADLEEANEKIDGLDTQVHDQGVQANELRSKLWQVQQEKDQAIAKFKSETKVQVEEYEERLEVETKYREDTEQDMTALELQIAQLEQNLAHTANTLNDTVLARDNLKADRDEQVAKLNRQLEDLRKKYTALETSSKSTIDALQATITDLTNEVNGLANTVAQLENSAIETAQQHAEDIAERDVKIEELEGDLTTAQKDNTNLVVENKSLAKRVENEANELLNIMGAHAEEVNYLREVALTHETHISDLQAAEKQRAEDHAEEIVEKEKAIEELRIMGGARVEHIVALEGQLEDIKDRFRAQVEDSQNTIDELVKSQRLAYEKGQELADATNQRAVDALKGVAEMKVPGLTVKAQGVELKKVAHGKVTKVSERVKISKKKGGVNKKAAALRSSQLRDSGYVDDFVEEDMELELADEGVVG